jgi:hypothetical protein
LVALLIRESAINTGLLAKSSLIIHIMSA